MTICDARGQGNELVTVWDQTTEISVGYVNVFNEHEFVAVRGRVKSS